MDTSFCIAINIKTGSDYETFGKFFLGKNKDFAYHLFSKLKGQTHVDDGCMLCIEMMEISNNLPLNIKMLSCTLDELGENTKIITKEIFKECNLAEM